VSVEWIANALERVRSQGTGKRDDLEEFEAWAGNEGGVKNKKQKNPIPQRVKTAWARTRGRMGKAATPHEKAKKKGKTDKKFWSRRCPKTEVVQGLLQCLGEIV